MRIKHTVNESYKVYSYLPCKGELFKDVKRWYPYKHYRTKQGAINAIKRFKQDSKYSYSSELVFKIIWSPYPFAGEDECIVVYNEDDV